MTRKLTLDDIVDLRAYERERDAFRQRVIAQKAVRRVGVGEFVTLLFENRDTIRYQIQEMARVEKILSDEGILQELEVYNPLIPESGQLRATLFVELTTKGDLMHWLPKLVSIEKSVSLVTGAGPGERRLPCIPDPGHEAQLTREEITASVHYIGWELDPSEVEAVAQGPVRVVIDHPAYQAETVLAPDTVAALLADLRPD